MLSFARFALMTWNTAIVMTTNDMDRIIPPKNEAVLNDLMHGPS